jgi:hypothetical protein
MKATIGKEYTLKEILSIPVTELDVYLQFRIDGQLYPLQDSHLNSEKLLSIEGFADTQWQYVARTRESIDVFTYVGSDIKQFVEKTEWGVGTSFYEIVYCPKGFVREDPWKGEN